MGAFKERKKSLPLSFYASLTSRSCCWQIWVTSHNNSGSSRMRIKTCFVYVACVVFAWACVVQELSELSISLVSHFSSVLIITPVTVSWCSTIIVGIKLNYTNDPNWAIAHHKKKMLYLKQKTRPVILWFLLCPVPCLSQLSSLGGSSGDFC